MSIKTVDFNTASNRIINTIDSTTKKVLTQAERVKQFRAEASRLASIANKRIQRLENNKFTDSPAYKRYISEGGQKFGVRGKTYNEVQREVARLRRFLDSETSTIRGVTHTLKEMAENTGIKYKNLEELKAKSSKFFELQSKVEQYLRTVDDMASAIGYQQIWEAINTYTQEQGIRLEDGSVSIDGMVEAVANALKAYDAKIDTPFGWYTIKKLTD